MSAEWIGVARPMPYCIQLLDADARVDELLPASEIAAELKTIRSLVVLTNVSRDAWNVLLTGCDHIRDLHLKLYEGTIGLVFDVVSSLFAKKKLRQLSFRNGLCDIDAKRMIRLACKYGKLSTLEFDSSTMRGLDNADYVDDLIELLERTKIKHFHSIGLRLSPDQKSRILDAAMKSVYIEQLFVDLDETEFDFTKLRGHVSLTLLDTRPEGEEVHEALTIARCSKTRNLSLLIWAMERGYLSKSYRDIIRASAEYLSFPEKWRWVEDEPEDDVPEEVLVEVAEDVLN